MRVAQFEDLLGSRVEAVAGRIESSGRQASDGLMARAEELSAGIRSHVEDAERSLTNLVVNTSETIQTGARTAQQSLLTVSSDVGAQLKLTSSEVERALTAVGTGAANSILTSAREAQTTLVTSSADAANQIKALSADVERTLSRRRDRASSGRRPRAQTTLHAPERATTSSRSPPTCSARCRRRHRHREPSPPAPARPRARWSRLLGGRQPVKALAADVQRSLSIAGTSTAEAIITGARDAQSTLITASARRAGQVARATLRSLSTPAAPPSRSEQRARGPEHAGHASADAANQVAAADVERTLSAAGAIAAHHRARETQQLARVSMPPHVDPDSRRVGRTQAHCVDLRRGPARSRRSADSTSLASVTATPPTTSRPARQRAERAGRRLERSQLQGQVDLGRRRTLGARRQQQLRLDHDRQDRRDRQLRAAADRPAGADDRRQARHAGRGASAPRPTSSRSTSTASPPMR